MSSRTPISSLPPSNSDLPPTAASSAGVRQLRCGYIALVGRPNAGKSTLFNALLGQRLSIVTAKPQTTRSRIVGILTRLDSQMIFLDTPGLLEPSYRLHEAMTHQIERSAREADVVLLLVDATRLDDRPDLIRRFLSSPLKGQVVVAVNKVDRLDNSAEMEKVRTRVARSLGLQTVICISALEGFQLDSMMAELESHLPRGPQLYPDEMVAEQPERFFTAELIREAAFNQLVDELPYAIQVVIEEFRQGNGADSDDSTSAGEEKDAPRGKAYIAATIYVERDSQMGIVIGRKGSRLRSIGRQARLQIEVLLEQEVYLDLRVKTRLDWRNRARDLREFGYE